MSLKTETIEDTAHIPAKPEEVFDAFMDAEKHAAFTDSNATIDPKVGGKFTIMDGYISGKNLKLEQGKRIVQEWKTSEWPDGYPPSVVDFSFKESKAGTELTFVQTKVPSEQAEDYRQGWKEFYWKPLKEYFLKK